MLWPSLLGTTLLLFANAFGAVATAYALTGSSLNIVPILLYAQIRGDVLHNPNLGYALALGMIVITGLSNGVYIWLRARSREVAPMKAQSRSGAWLAIDRRHALFLRAADRDLRVLACACGAASTASTPTGSCSADPHFQATFGYSVLMALLTIVVGVLLVVPTAYWVRLRLPQLRPVVEFITLLPLVIPAIVIVFGYIRMYNSSLDPAADRQRARHRPAAGVRLRHAGAALHVPRRRHRPARHRRPHADRGGPEPRRRLADDHVPGDPPNVLIGGAVAAPS